MDTINQWKAETEETLDSILQTVAYRIGESVVMLSPVDTGLFKGNWQFSLTGTNASLLREDKDGTAVLADMLSGSKTFTAGQVAYIQNHLDYGWDLEHGYSPQARDPDGMVRVTALRFTEIVNEAVKLHSK
jgi:hypothetical protein